MVIRRTFDKKLHAAILIDWGAIFVIDSPDGISSGEEVNRFLSLRAMLNEAIGM